MRVLLLGFNHASVINSYCIGLEQHGVQYRALSFEDYRSIYADYSKIDTVLSKNVYNRAELLQGLWKLFRAVQWADVIHVFSDFVVPSKLGKLAGAILYNRRNKKYYITFTGSDIRNPEIELEQNPYFHYAYNNVSYEGKPYETKENSIRLQTFFSTRGFRMIATPETIPFIDRSLFPRYYVSHHPSIITNFSNAPSTGKVRIAHAASSPVAKGTAYVLSAVENMQKKVGDKIEFNLLRGLSQREYQEHLAKTDILIDQLIWGWYGVASQQALQAGKVVVAYLHKDRLDYVSDCPIVNANISDLEQVLEKLVTDAGALESLGKKGREYYEKFHSPATVVGAAIQYYQS